MCDVCALVTEDYVCGELTDIAVVHYLLLRNVLLSRHSGLDSTDMNDAVEQSAWTASATGHTFGQFKWSLKTFMFG